jgi:voltage-gated potassium channel
MSAHFSAGLQHLNEKRMTFVNQVVVAIVLVTATLFMQCAGMAVLIHWAKVSIERGLKTLSAWRASVLMIRLTTALIILHFAEILFWATAYRWCCLASWESSFYFSATSYSTVGYGDVVLPRIWRLLGPVESMTGVLMSGISVSVLFAILVRMVGNEDSSSRVQQTRAGSFEGQPREAVSVNEIG